MYFQLLKLSRHIVDLVRLRNLLFDSVGIVLAVAVVVVYLIHLFHVARMVLFLDGILPVPLQLQLNVLLELRDPLTVHSSSIFRLFLYRFVEVGYLGFRLIDIDVLFLFHFSYLHSVLILFKA